MQRISVVRSGGLGDTLLALPELSALRRRYPSASIEAAGSTQYWPLAGALADAVHHVDDLSIAGIFGYDAEEHLAQRFSNLDLLISWTSRQVRVGKGPRVVFATPYPPPGIHAADWLVRTLIDAEMLDE